MSEENETSWLDKNFLEKALDKEIDNFEVKPMGGKNEYFTSTLFRVQVELKSNETKHLIVKKILENKVNGHTLSDTSMFDREIHAYSVVLPKLSALLEKAIPGCEPIVPEYIFSSTGVLVLEDLSASGFKVPEKFKVQTLHQLLLVMQTTARFHAASVILHQQEPEIFKLYEHQLFTEPAMKQSLAPFFTNMLRLLADEVVNWPGYERYSKKFRDMSGRVIEHAAEAAQRKEDRFNVLTHDDLWLNNMLFKPPASLRIIDFQMLHYASLGNDLQLFLCCSVDEEIRQNHIDTLLKEYHKTFCDVLTALGYNGRMLTFEDVQEEFRKSAPYALILNLGFLPTSYVSSDVEIPMFDSEGGPLKVNYYDDVNVKDAMIKLMVYFEKQGAFDYLP